MHADPQVDCEKPAALQYKEKSFPTGRTELKQASAEQQIVFTVNGPGEVASWLTPLVGELKRVRPDLYVSVALVPCVFSSGGETAVAKSLPQVDAVCSVQDSWAFSLKGKLPAGFREDLPGIVFHLGGDPFFSQTFAKRMHLPALAYIERKISVQWMYDRVFYSGFDHIPSKQLKPNDKVIGEMIVDAAVARTPNRRAARGERVTIGLYPGSRDYMVKYLLPFYAIVVDRLAKQMPNLDWVIAKAGFLPLDAFRSLENVDDGRAMAGVGVRMIERDGATFMVTPGGVEMLLTDNGEVAARSDVVVTLPGTNTAELAALGVPMVMVLPTWSVEITPLPGLGGHLARIPVIGLWLKRKAAAAAISRYKFFTHPNRRADKLLVPELVGEVTPDELETALDSLIRSDTSQLERDLRATMGAPGAARRLAGEIVDYLEQQSEVVHAVAPAR